MISRVPVPVGTGLLIAGGNGNEVRGNHIWDNWRRGVGAPSPAPLPAAEYFSDRKGGSLGAQATLQSSTCADWRLASPRTRRVTVDRLEVVVRGTLGLGNTLPDGRAYAAIDSRCGRDFALGFLLYEIYTRAAAFKSLIGAG